MMTGVLDNLASINEVLGTQMPAIGPTVLARSAIEIASGAWWLMEPVTASAGMMSWQRGIWARIGHGVAAM
jgi:hypothetical protein